MLIQTLEMQMITKPATNEFIWFKLLPVIAEFESGNDPKKVGPKGEVTVYQILPINMVSSSNHPSRYAQIAYEISIECIRKYCNYHKTPTPPDYYHFYLIWNRGFTGYKRYLKNRKIDERAIRFQNLCMKRIDGKN